MKIFFNWIPTCQALICSLLSTDATPILAQCHKRSYIVLLGNVFQLMSKLTKNVLPLVDHQNNPHPCSISQKKRYLFTSEFIPMDFETVKHWCASCWAPMQNPRVFNITEQVIFYCLEICSNWFLNCQALICLSLINNATPTPVKYMKKSCIFLIWN